MVKDNYFNNNIVMLTAHSSQLHYYSLTLNSIIAIFYAFSYVNNFEITSYFFTVVYIIIIKFISICHDYNIYRILNKKINNFGKRLKINKRIEITLNSKYKFIQNKRSR